MYSQIELRSYDYYAAVSRSSRVAATCLRSRRGDGSLPRHARVRAPPSASAVSLKREIRSSRSPLPVGDGERLRHRRAPNTIGIRGSMPGWRDPARDDVDALSGPYLSDSDARHRVTQGGDSGFVPRIGAAQGPPGRRSFRIDPTTASPSSCAGGCRSKAAARRGDAPGGRPDAPGYESTRAQIRRATRRDVHDHSVNRRDRWR